MTTALQFPRADQGSFLRAVTLYGMGGVGKTQIALEYAYRFRAAYSHLFWIKSETEFELRQSFTALVQSMSIKKGDEGGLKDVELAQKWLEMSDGRWLLVFDNVQQVSLLRRYWPRSVKGNIVITSQRASFDEFTTKNFRIRPLTVEEGRTLILRQMHLEDGDETTRARAEELSEELGGSPLAITHYTGFCVTSHLSLTEVLRSFQQTSLAADIWSCDSNASAMQYERTLSTVWDTTLDSLSESERDLLDMLAFLNPDCVPEDFLKNVSRLDTLGEENKSSFRLTATISGLVRRNLIERNISMDRPSLRMHRALRLALVMKMDTNLDKRQNTFEKALRLTRDAFPRRDMTSRMPRNEHAWKMAMPQVLALQSAFERSDPPISGSMKFASLLGDAGSLLWEQQLSRVALPALLLGERIALRFVEKDEPDSVLANLENCISMLVVDENPESRQANITRMKRVVRRRERILSSLPPGQATIEQQVDVGRAWNDLGYLYADLEQFQEADKWMMKSLALYKTLGDESTLRFRFALQYADITVVRIAQGHIEEALGLARKSFELFKEELGREHLETATFEAQLAYALIASGNLNEALLRLTDVLAIRSKNLDGDNPGVLTTKYWIGMVHYYLDHLDDAESFLRETINLSSNSGLGQPALARARYRLCLVLYEKQQRKEALALEEEAIAAIPEEILPPVEHRDEIARLLDRRVYVQYGRSTGVFRGWRDGKV